MTHTDAQTDRRTDAHTHTLGSIATYSVKMTEYKKSDALSIEHSQIDV